MSNNCMNCGAMLMDGATVCPVCRQPVAPAQSGGSWQPQQQQPARSPSQQSPYGPPPAARGNTGVNPLWLVAIGVLVLMVVGVIAGLMVFIKSQKKSMAQTNENYNHNPRGIPTPYGTDSTTPQPPPPPPEPNSRTTNNSKAPISGGVLNGKALILPKPAYPPIARAARASGTVVVQVTIDESGKVISARAVSGHPLLQASAVQAAYQARFAPTLLSGQPVKVTGTLSYNYTLE
jgi:TonB family protein